MVNPVSQRLTFLQDLLKQTAGEDLQADLIAAIDVIQRVLNQANDSIDKEHRAIAVADLATRVDDWKQLKLETFGELLLFGNFTVLKGDGGKDTEREVRKFFDELDPSTKPLLRQYLLDHTGPKGEDHSSQEQHCPPSGDVSDLDLRSESHLTPSLRSKPSLNLSPAATSDPFFGQETFGLPSQSFFPTDVFQDGSPSLPPIDENGTTPGEGKKTFSFPKFGRKSRDSPTTSETEQSLPRSFPGLSVKRSLKSLFLSANKSVDNLGANPSLSPDAQPPHTPKTPHTPRTPSSLRISETLEDVRPDARLGNFDSLLFPTISSQHRSREDSPSTRESLTSSRKDAQTYPSWSRDLFESAEQNTLHESDSGSSRMTKSLISGKGRSQDDVTSSLGGSPANTLLPNRGSDQGTTPTRKTRKTQTKREKYSHAIGTLDGLILAKKHLKDESDGSQVPRFQRPEKPHRAFSRREEKFFFRQNGPLMGETVFICSDPPCDHIPKPPSRKSWKTMNQYEKEVANEEGICCPSPQQYQIFLFERILLCCKDMNPNKQKSTIMGGKQKPLLNQKGRLRLQLKGRIFMANVTEVICHARQGKQNLHVAS